MNPTDTWERTELPAADAVGRELRVAGLVGAEQKLRVDPIPRNPERRDFLTRTAYRVFADDQPFCHLVIGRDLAQLKARAEAFAQACPDIACPVRFWLQSAGWDYLGSELFEGRDLETMVREGSMIAEEALRCAEKAVTALNRTFLPSDAAAANAELQAFFASVCASPLFSGLDQQFLHSAIFPFIRAGAISSAPQTRWSNGDFIARNLLADTQGRIRLVDYEFAARTHFYAEDWWRWRSLSALPAETLTLPALRGDIAPGPWLEAFFLLRHAVLVHDINGAAVAMTGIRHQMDRLVALATEANTGFRASVFLQPLAGQIPRSPTPLGYPSLPGEHGMRLSAAAGQERLRQTLLERLRRNEDKIARMQQSFSWRATAPLRWLRRYFLDRTKPAPTVIHQIDFPTVWESAPSTGVIVGWCLQPDGRPVRGIRGRFDGAHVVNGRYGFHREAVKQSHGFDRAESCACGFAIPYQLSEEIPHPVELEVTTDGARWHLVAKHVLIPTRQPSAVRGCSK